MIKRIDFLQQVFRRRGELAEEQVGGDIGEIVVQMDREMTFSKQRTTLQAASGRRLFMKM